MRSHAQLKIAIFLSYAVFAILLNSVGTVILQSIEFFDVDKGAASTLEGFKDLPIAITSFLLASLLPRLGYRNAMMIGLAIVALACVAMPLIPSFWTTRILFLAVGVGFAVTKVAVYSFVGLLTDDSRGHASLLNLVEGMFMLGVLGGYWLFSAFIDAEDPGSAGWLDVYWLLAAACMAAIVLLALSRFQEAGAKVEGAETTPAQDFAAMLALAARPLTIMFVISVFLYVLIEQGIGSWLPTFNRELLGLSVPMSVQAASIFAVGIAAGRLGAGVVVRKTGAYPLLAVCLIGMASLILVVLPLAETQGGEAVSAWTKAPLAAFIFPLIGLFMAPIYPILNSAILSAMPRSAHASMIGLIVVFSALGGTTGSLIVGQTFAATGGSLAFYLLLVPIGGLAAAIFALRAFTRRAERASSSALDESSSPQGNV